MKIIKRISSFVLVILLFLLLSIAAQAAEKNVLVTEGTTVSEALGALRNIAAVTDENGAPVDKSAPVKNNMRIMFNGEVIGVLFIRGDADGDGAVTSADARTVLRFSVGLDENNGQVETVADADLNGEVDASDARSLLRVSVGLDAFTDTGVHSHDFSVLTETVKPTCSSYGYEVYACECSAKIRTTVPMLAHFYEDGVCVNCGDTGGYSLLKKYRNFVIANGECTDSVYVYSTGNNGAADCGLLYDSKSKYLCMYYMKWLDEEKYIYIETELKGPDDEYSAYVSIHDGNSANAYAEFVLAYDYRTSLEKALFDRYTGDTALTDMLKKSTADGVNELLEALSGSLPEELAVEKLGFRM